MEEKVKKKTEELKLNPNVWEVPYNSDLVAQVLYVFFNNERKGTSAVKGRAEVSGGGKKPWKQKGTGRARHGSIRSPIWVGGGVAFGPNVRNWKKSINKGMVKKAICVVLTQRKREDVVEFVKIDKEKEYGEIRDKFGKNVTKKTLIITDSDNVKLALRNMKIIRVVNPMRVNVKNITEAKNILIDKDSLNILETRLTNGK